MALFALKKLTEGLISWQWPILYLTASTHCREEWHPVDRISPKSGQRLTLCRTSITNQVRRVLFQSDSKREGGHGWFCTTNTMISLMDDPIKDLESLTVKRVNVGLDC